MNRLRRLLAWLKPAQHVAAKAIVCVRCYSGVLKPETQERLLLRGVGASGELHRIGGP